MELEHQSPLPERRPAPPPSPYDSPAAQPRPNVVDLPVGYRAYVEAEPTSTGFLGKTFSMDSTEVMRWAANYFHDNHVGLRLLVWFIGHQEVGGTVEHSQQQIADSLKVTRTSVSRNIALLCKLGLVHSPSRGKFQLNPAVILRGGVKLPKASSGRRVGEKIDQLALFAEAMADEKVPEAFKALLRANETSPLPKATPKKVTRSRKKPDEEKSDV